MRRAAFALLFTTLLLSVGVTTAEAQETGTIRGSVTAQGSTLSGAQISLVGTNRGTLTNEQGRYQMVGLRPGQHTLRVQSIGFQASEVTVNVAPGEVVTQNFDLNREAVNVAGVTVTVGSRAAHTAADELPVPVDVFEADEIQAANKMEMAEVLQELAPSINFPRPQIADITSGVRPFQLRGLSPDHSLVLINGKRRHPTAVVHVFGAGAMTPGSSGVDINAIAPSAIARMDILRDGAAAQYGSDAIAGVINMVLRNDVHAPEFSASIGQHRPGDYDPDGRRFDLSGNVGFPLFADATMNLTLAVQDRQRTQRAGPDPRDQIVVGDGDVVSQEEDEPHTIIQKNNEIAMPNHLDGDGRARNYMLFWNSEMPLNEDNTSQAYLFGSYSRRRDIHSGFFRRSLDNRNWPGIHPLGFLPEFRAVTEDVMAVGGFRGLAGEWQYDLSGQFGRNKLHNTIQNSLNVSLGPCLDVPCAPGKDKVLGTVDDPGIPNATSFYAGSLLLNQYVASLDFSRTLDFAGGTPLNFATGVTYRGDNYQIEAGEPGSYVNGYYPNRSGGIAAAGSQVFTGYLPGQAVNDTRHSVGVYADVEKELSDMFLLAGAARYENYSDFGSTVTGKIAARLQPVEAFILRGAVSTGFRAPSQSQSFYGHVSTGFREDPNDPDNQVAYEIGEFPVNAPEAVALGSAPLEEETSLNLSAGMAWTPVANLNLTVDVYRIDIDDRIILSGTMEGPTVEALLAGYTAESVRFMTNAIDTRTQGIDVTAGYRYLFDSDRYLQFTGAYNRNNQEILDIHIPPVIEELRDQVFDRTSQVTFEEGRPKDRFTSTLRFITGPFHASTQGTYYGPITVLDTEGANGNPDILYTYSSDWLFDLEAGYDVNDYLSISVGAENVFDVFPDVRNTFNGIFTYGSSGFGYNGRYVYTRVRATAPW